MTDHHPVPEPPELLQRQSRLALRLFVLYLLAYGGFMGLSAFTPQLMSQVVLSGVNLAIIYGLGLILGAVVLAVIYMVLCQRLAAAYERERGRA